MITQHPHRSLLAVILPICLWSAYRPYEVATWWMEVIPVFLGALAIFIAYRRQWVFSNLALTLIGLHMIILLVGGHYTYARVPLGDWAMNHLGFSRNHYDRIGHFIQGFVPVMLCRELLVRHHIVNHPKWLAFLCFCFALAFSAFYELIEMTTALCSANGAVDFLGTQGDPWDTQWDMLLAAIGATCALISLTHLHNLSIRKIQSPSSFSKSQVLPPR